VTTDPVVSAARDRLRAPGIWRQDLEIAPAVATNRSDGADIVRCMYIDVRQVTVRKDRATGIGRRLGPRLRTGTIANPIFVDIGAATAVPFLVLVDGVSQRDSLTFDLPSGSIWISA